MQIFVALFLATAIFAAQVPSQEAPVQNAEQVLNVPNEPTCTRTTSQLVAEIAQIVVQGFDQPKADTNIQESFKTLSQNCPEAQRLLDLVVPGAQSGPFDIDVALREMFGTTELWTSLLRNNTWTKLKAYATKPEVLAVLQAIVVYIESGTYGDNKRRAFRLLTDQALFDKVEKDKELLSAMVRIAAASTLSDVSEDDRTLVNDKLRQHQALLHILAPNLLRGIELSDKSHVSIGGDMASFLQESLPALPLKAGSLVECAEALALRSLPDDVCTRFVEHAVKSLCAAGEEDSVYALGLHVGSLATDAVFKAFIDSLSTKEKLNVEFRIDANIALTQMPENRATDLMKAFAPIRMLPSVFQQASLIPGNDPGLFFSTLTGSVEKAGRVLVESNIIPTNSMEPFSIGANFDVLSVNKAPLTNRAIRVTRANGKAGVKVEDTGKPRTMQLNMHVASEAHAVTVSNLSGSIACAPSFGCSIIVAIGSMTEAIPADVVWAAWKQSINALLEKRYLLAQTAKADEDDMARYIWAVCPLLVISAK